MRACDQSVGPPRRVWVTRRHLVLGPHLAPLPGLPAEAHLGLPGRAQQHGDRGHGGEIRAFLKNTLVTVELLEKRGMRPWGQISKVNATPESLGKRRDLIGPDAIKSVLKRSTGWPKTCARRVAWRFRHTLRGDGALTRRTRGVPAAVGRRGADDGGAPDRGAPSSGALSARGRSLARVARRARRRAPARAPFGGGVRRLAASRI